MIAKPRLLLDVLVQVFAEYQPVSVVSDAARSLAGAPVDITIIDRRNFHLFQPLLYQVATAALNPVARQEAKVLRRRLREALEQAF